MFFHFISENAILEVKNIQQNNSFTSLNEPKTILKTTERSYHITRNQRKFPKNAVPLQTPLTYCDFSPPSCTKLSDSLVQAQKQYGSN